jgi:hypothetical protein
LPRVFLFPFDLFEESPSLGQRHPLRSGQLRQYSFHSFAAFSSLRLRRYIPIKFSPVVDTKAIISFGRLGSFPTGCLDYLFIKF